MKLKTVYLLSALCLLMAACKNKEVSFTYSPETPRAGETVKFTNNTEEGETWEWDFGDGTVSSSKNPSKVYKKPGTYTVILKVDEKKSRTCTESITIIDTVPSVTLQDDTIAYYQVPTRLHMDVYNPYGKDETVQWLLNDDVALVDGELDEKTITIRFLKHSQKVSVSCHLTLGTTEYDCTSAFFVNDTLAPSLMMATDDGRLLRQRLFEDDTEEAAVCPASKNASTSINSIVCEGDYAYLFSEDQTPQGGLYTYNLVDSSEYRIAYNGASGLAQGFGNGCFYNGMLFWANYNDGNIYQLSSSARDCAFVGGNTSAQYWGSIFKMGYDLSIPYEDITGMQWYNDVAFVCYGGAIYRFTAADRNSSTTPSAGAILVGKNVQHFTVDKIAKKVYYLKPQGLYVCNINGDNERLLSNVTLGKALCVDNFMNRLYWATGMGVYYLPLVQTANNATQSEPVKLNAISNVKAIAIDATPRYCFHRSDTYDPNAQTDEGTEESQDE